MDGDGFGNRRISGLRTWTNKWVPTKAERERKNPDRGLDNLCNYPTQMYVGCSHLWRQEVKEKEKKQTKKKKQANKKKKTISWADTSKAKSRN